MSDSPDMPIAPSTLRLPGGPWTTVFECLCAHFPAITATQWSARFERGLVLDIDHQAITLSHAYRDGLTVHYFREVEDEPRIPFVESLVHVDDHIVVADKPHFLPVTPGGRFVRETLLARLIDSLGNPELVPLHRIDRGTAGLVLFSANRTSRSHYQALFRTGAVHKLYEAIATPLPTLPLPHRRESRIVRGEPFFRMREEDGEPNAVTVVESMALVDAACGAPRARYCLQPVTGRKHQLRVHMAALGAPIADDPLYPQMDPTALPHARVAGDWRAPPEDYARPLQLLARTLSFQDPLSGERRRFDSRLRLE